MRRYDAVLYLDDQESITAFLELAAERNDKDLFSNCLASALIARAINQLSLDTGIGRKKLCEILLNGAKPTRKSVAKVIKALCAPLPV
jgi:probable addiction module antidote protein